MAFKRQTVRPRLFHKLFASAATEADLVTGHIMEYAEDVVYFFGDIGFIIGSIFFFAKWYDDVGLAGLWMFIIISAINLVLGTHDLYETVQAKKLGLLKTLERNEVLECSMNVFSALLFLIGCIIELPKFENATFKFADLFSVFGSAALVVSSFYNALGMAADKTESLMSRVCLFCTLMGSVMFTVGATLYLPEISNVDLAYTLGTWLYVLGSVLFTLSGFLGIVMVYQAQQAEKQAAKEKGTSSL